MTLARRVAVNPVAGPPPLDFEGWIRLDLGASTAFVTGIAVDATNIYVVADGDISGVRPIVAKLDHSLNLIWVKTFTAGANTANVYATGALIGSNGDLYVTSTTVRSGIASYIPAIFRIDSNGNPVSGMATYPSGVGNIGSRTDTTKPFEYNNRIYLGGRTGSDTFGIISTPLDLSSVTTEASTTGFNTTTGNNLSRNAFNGDWIYSNVREHVRLNSSFVVQEGISVAYNGDYSSIVLSNGEVVLFGQTGGNVRISHRAADFTLIEDRSFIINSWWFFRNASVEINGDLYIPFTGDTTNNGAGILRISFNPISIVAYQEVTHDTSAAARIAQDLHFNELSATLLTGAAMFNDGAGLNNIGIFNVRTSLDYAVGTQAPCDTDYKIQDESTSLQTGASASTTPAAASDVWDRYVVEINEVANTITSTGPCAWQE